MSSFKGSNDRLDYSSMLFRVMDRISAQTQTAFEENFVGRGSVGALPCHKVRGLKSQVFVLESLLYPYLSRKYFERAVLIKKRLNSIGEGGTELTFYWTQRLLQYLVLEAYSNGFLIKKSADFEDEEADSELETEEE